MVLPLAVLVVYLIFAVLVGLCGSQRRMGFTGTFLLSVAITPTRLRRLSGMAAGLGGASVTTSGSSGVAGRAITGRRVG